eukprot:11605-Heterococcus_DN1.PRE.2
MSSRRLSKVVPPLTLPSNTVLMEEMAMYAEKLDVDAMFQEYLKRVLLEKPQDPIAFLIAQIKQNPFTPAAASASGSRPQQQEAAKHIELRSTEVTTALLTEIFELCEKTYVRQLTSNRNVRNGKHQH